MRSTGDVGYIDCGQIWYCGRKDRQIKRLGKRMSLDWLEHCLSKAFPDCTFSAVQENPNVTQPGQLYLFVKPTSLHDESNFPVLLRQGFHDYLPAYAHPDQIVIVNAFPMTSHGKLDTKKMLRSIQKEIPSPQMTVKEFLTGLWVKVVGAVEEDTMSSASNSPPTEKDLSSNDNHVQDTLCDGKIEINSYVNDEDRFVESGGTSLDALRMANEIEVWLHARGMIELHELIDLILNGTFGRLCDYVERKLSKLRGYSDVLCTNISKGLNNSEEKLWTSDFDEHWEIPTQTVCTEDDSSEQHDERLHSFRIHETQSSNNDNTEEMNSKLEGISFDSEDITYQLSSKRIKSESSCYCSMERGKRFTLCTPCRKSPTLFNPDKCRDTLSLSNQHSETLTQRHVEHEFSLKWKTDFHKCIDASPLVVSVHDRDRAVVYLGSHAHVFKAVELSGGKVLWETCVGDRVESSAALSRCGFYVIVGKRLEFIEFHWLHDEGIPGFISR